MMGLSLRQGRRPLRAILPAVTLLLSFAVSAGALELPYRYPEQQVRAAFLLNFARFTVWPEAAFADAGAPLVLAIDDPELLAVAAELLQGRSATGRPVTVRRYRPGEAAFPPHLLYLANAEMPPAALRGLPVLTVGGHPGFTAAGGHVELLRSGRRLRFGINRAALRRSGVSIHAQVLNLAVFVREAEEEGR